MDVRKVIQTIYKCAYRHIGMLTSALLQPLSNINDIFMYLFTMLYNPIKHIEARTYIHILLHSILYPLS